MADKYLRAECRDKQDRWFKNEQNMNLCLSNESGKLQWKKEYVLELSNCFFEAEKWPLSGADMEVVAEPSPSPQ